MEWEILPETKTVAVSRGSIVAAILVVLSGRRRRRLSSIRRAPSASDWLE